MKTEIIRSTIDKSNNVLSIGNYWDNSGLTYKLRSFEYIGDEQGLHAAIQALKDSDCDFQHVIERQM